MPRAPFPPLMLSTATLCALSLLWAAPVLAQASTREIDAALAGGRLDRAQLLLNLVLQNQPSSAHAHYLQAELFAQEGSADAARVELSRAETLTPGLPGENPADVTQFRQAIAPVATATRAAERHFPLGLAVAGAALWWLLRRRLRLASDTRTDSPGADDRS